MLFLELTLIRWTAAENVRLAYITNFVLIASFLGIGLGFLLADSRRDLFRWSPIGLAGLVAFVYVFPVKLLTLSGPHELQGRFGIAPLPQKVSLPVIFLLVTFVLAGVGQETARTFVQFRALDAYRMDILGSIAGIVIFTLLSFLETAPMIWGVLAAIVFIVLLRSTISWKQWAALVVAVALLGLDSFSSMTYWSPYYKITAVQPPGTRGELVISANGIPHQTAYTVATLHKVEAFYFFPYRHVNRSTLDNVLIIGAGTGNDVAVALSEGAKHVDAVEIDPVIASLGRKYNLDRPYQSRRVTLHNTDGRAFLEQTTSKYNLILFALPDSLTLLPGASYLRLENFLLDEQSMQAARQHLAPGGTFSMYNYYEASLLDRYASTLKAVYGFDPCAEVGAPLANRRQAVLTVDLNRAAPGCATPWHGKTTSPATDDHPFPYLASSTIPSFYWWMIGLILAGSLVLIRATGVPFRRMSSYIDLAWMGASFTLLETKNVVQFALLFGTTWLVNSLVFAGVLVSVYAAVETARHVRLPKPIVLYGALLAALATAWAIPQDDLLKLSFAPRFVAATAIAFAPVFIANLVFAQRFRNVGSSTTAFGANLLGAIFGAVLEYLALITGYRFLLVVVAALYALAFLFGRRQLATA
ncbi:MAG: Spermine synthase [Acidimicrobiaceae bacterium]|nr:Spermine synthase [Acidimicrobiaceae bacterium]